MARTLRKTRHDYYVSLEEKQAFTEAPVTLDGRPAKVCGYNRPEATIRAGEAEVTFSWPSVRFIIETKEGHFFS